MDELQSAAHANWHAEGWIRKLFKYQPQEKVSREIINTTLSSCLSNCCTDKAGWTMYQSIENITDTFKLM